jgi:hypothetical protein
MQQLDGRAPTDRGLERARLHVLEGLRIVADQRKRIEQMRRRGLEVSGAQSTLDLFEQSLVILEDHLQSMESEEAERATKNIA